MTAIKFYWNKNAGLTKVSVLFMSQKLFFAVFPHVFNGFVRFAYI